MLKRRIPQDRYRLAQLLAFTSNAVRLDPLWGAIEPTHEQLLAVSDAINSGTIAMIAAENTLQGLRGQIDMDFKEGHRLMRLIDSITSGLYGESSGEKLRFGLRPIDRVRNMPKAPKAPTKLSLKDGAAAATLALSWKRVPGARYLAEAWYGVPEAEGSTIIAAKSETASRSMFSGLTVGAQVFCRVRIIAGKRSGPWSRTLSRFVNV